MRIISQDGTIDLPYECIALKASQDDLVAFYGSERFVLGTFETNRDAKDALIEIVYAAINDGVGIFRMDKVKESYAEQ